MQLDQLKRRQFISLIGGATAAWPVAALAQVPVKRPLIAVMSLVARERNLRMLDAFMAGLRQLDFVDGRDFELALRSADARLDRSASLAQEVVALRPDVILATATPAVVSLTALTKTVPIVCPLLADPVRLGLIASMSHPGGNVTGVLFRTEGLVGKQLELALQLIPGARRIGFLVNVAAPVVIDREGLENLSRSLGLELNTIEVRAPDDLDAAFSALRSSGVQAIVVQTDPMFFNERERISALAAATRLPVVYAFRDHVDAGGLISYGVSLAGCFHGAASYVVRILKGARPGELPVEFPTKLELIINLRTATTLGLTVPSILLATADEVIE
jgi:putative ABC transport system substrate-binding protein